MSISLAMAGQYGHEILTGASTVSSGPYVGLTVTGGAAVTITTTGPGPDNFSSCAVSDGTSLVGRWDSVQFVSGSGVLVVYHDSTSSNAI